MRKLKNSKLLALTLSCVLFIGALAGCGGASANSAAPAQPSTASESTAPAESTPPPESTAPAGDIRVGVVMPSATHGFTGESIQHAQAEVEKLAAERGFEYKFLTAEEASGQVTHIETLMTWDPNVIILWPIEGDALRSAAQSVMDAGVQLIIYDRLIENFKPTAEIMGDNETIGKMTGEYFNKFFADQIAAGEKISYLEFMGDSSTVPKQRSDGFKSTINPAFELGSEPYSTGWQRQTAMDQMENWLNTSSKEKVEALQAIFTHDDEVVLGVLDALKGYTGDAKLNVKLLSGVGGRKENIATFTSPGVEGLKQVTYSFSPSMIRNAIQMGINAAYGEKYNGADIAGLILIPTQEIDESNMAEYEASDLFKERYSI